MVNMGLDKIVHHGRDPCHASILNDWIKDWESDILRTRYQENEKRLLQKYKNIRFLDDEDNQTYIIAPEKLEYKGHIRRNKQFFVVGQSLDRRDGDNMDLLISININDYFMVLIKGFEKDPDLGVKIVHPSIDNDSEATESEIEENNDDNSPKTPCDDENMYASSDDDWNNDKDAPETPYDGENINAYSNNEGNNDEVTPDPPTNDVNINANSDDKINDYEVNPDTPTNGGNNETIENDEEK